jgi:hypothetical protein
VKTLEALTGAALAKAERRLLNPEPGSMIAEAKEYGVDTTLLISQLRLTPDERAHKLQRAAMAMRKIRGAARGRS